MSYITSVGVAVPPHSFSQDVIAQFMVRAMQLDETESRKLSALYRATGINTRHSVVQDYGRERDFDFYSNTPHLEPFPSTAQRIGLFQKHAASLSIAAVKQCLAKAPHIAVEQLTHLVVVSCTGMYAPGLDIDLMRHLGLNSAIERTCINFMGCYAAFNAMKVAHAFCESSSQAKVLVVCTELCSIHFQKENTEDNWLANALFADGSAAVLVEAQSRKGINLKPASFYCDVALNGAHDMAWSIGNMGFEMKLSSYVPDVIRKGIKQLTASLLARIGKSIQEITFFAIHPGGKRILEVIEEELGLQRKQNAHAYEVLRKYGNMSSPTVLFVLNELIQTLTAADNNKEIISFAFGPGLTLESMVLEIEIH